MNRVVVVGPPGSGKSTLAERVAARLGCEHVELDGLWWEPGWQEAGTERYLERLRPVATRDRWVVSGNYTSKGTSQVLWPRADAIVWLDLPRRVTIPRILRRTASRVVRRTDLWGTGNRETLRQVLRSDSILWFAWKVHPSYGERYAGTDDPRWVRLRSPREVRRWLLTLPSHSDG